jgi:hypothetical protein
MAKISSVSLPKLAPRRRLRHWPDGQVLGRQVSVVFAFASLHSVFDYFHPQLIVREKLGLSERTCGVLDVCVTSAFLPIATK